MQPDGKLHYQWLGNFYYDARGTFQKGWRSVGDGMGYYTDGRLQFRKDEPWTGEHTEHPVYEKELIARGTDLLTKDKKLNAKIWKLITEQFGPETVWPQEQ